MNTQTFSTQVAEAHLWRSVWKLLRLRWVIFSSSFRRGNLRYKIRMVILMLLLLGGLAFAFYVSWMMLQLLRSPLVAQFAGEAHALLSAMPVLVVTAAVAGIFVTSFGLLLQALYLAGDMDFLLSAPIPIRAIFITKLLQAILPNFGLILLFSLPVLYGLGASAGFHFLYYPLTPLMLALTSLATAGLSSLLVMVVVRIFPARRVAEVLGFFVAIFSFICSQSGQVVNLAQIPQSQAVQLFGRISRFNAPWSPLAWVGNGLVAIGEGRWLSGLGLLLLTTALCCGVFALSLTVAERLYYTGWASVQITPRRQKAPAVAPPAKMPSLALTSLVNRLLTAPVSAVIAKDIRMLRRDLRNMSQLVMPLILGIVYAFLFLRRGGAAPAGRGEAPEAFMEAMNNLWVFGNVGIALFVGWILLSRLAMMAFSQEGKNYWIIKKAPLSAGRLLLAKFLVAYLPSLGLCSLFVVAITALQHAGAGMMIFSLAVVALTLAGTAGVNLAFGVLGANFTWEDPRQISQRGMGCLGTLAGTAYLGFDLMFFFAPALLLSGLGLPTTAGQAIGLALGGAFSLAGAILTPWLVRKQVPRLAEE